MKSCAAYKACFTFDEHHLTAVWAIVMFRPTFLILWLVFVGMSMSAPTDEFNSFIGGELSMNNEGPLMGIVPGSYSTQGSQKNGNFFYDSLERSVVNRLRISKKGDIQTDFFMLQKHKVTHDHYNKFWRYMNKGTIKKGLTFNIYDEDMREAAISLFELIHIAENLGHKVDKLFNYKEMNEDLVSYVFHIHMLYSADKDIMRFTLPLFIAKPNFFVNGETIIKAIKLSHQMNDFLNNSEEALAGQYYKTKNAIVINTNYSGWNLPYNGGEEELNYFREDISLNSYYYGIHLMHPFWMMDHKLLNTVNPKHNEHYYFLHQQLVARLLLEKEHVIEENKLTNKSKIGDYNPYLIHDNGLPFPVRNHLKDWSEDRAQIKAIDIAIRECIDRGLLIMENSDYVKMTPENYVSLITKLVRANFEAGKAAKMIRSLYGYGVSGYPFNEYNPAPSTLHYPQTSLRDPMYWTLMQHVLNYYTEYEKSIDPYHLYQYETKSFEIINVDIPKIITFFDYYQFNINNAISKNELSLHKMPLVITARHKRLKHSKFSLNFTVGSQQAAQGVVRLFLGPACEDDCWDKYSKFFELDKFIFSFEEGMNTVTWSPESSNNLSSDDIFNMLGSVPVRDRKYKYNMFKFPDHLVIPRGLENGLNLSLFIMITPPDATDEPITPANNLYGTIFKELDNKPFGFPFHRPTKAPGVNGINYKFYNITIYHKLNGESVEQKNGYFSPHLS